MVAAPKPKDPESVRICVDMRIANKAIKRKCHPMTTIYVDASPVGLGAILMQKHPDGQKVITYASKALSPVEQRYSQTEREALAVVWRLNIFTFIYLERQ